MTLRKILLSGLLWSFVLPAFSQFSTCDTTAINAHLNPAGFTRLYVPNQPCSMYFYSTSYMYGITAHLDAINLGVPQLVINNAQEDTDVNTALYAAGVFPGTDEVWMGITDSATIYTWRTFAGAPAPAYTNWASGEPNDDPPSCEVGGSCLFCFGADAYWCAHGEDCAVLNNVGQWLDITCEGSNVTHIAVLELNTCPVVIPPHDTTVCLGNSVQVTASTDSGGTAPYTYSWSPGGQTGQSVSISPLVTDTFTVQISDLYHCYKDSTFIIAVNPNTPVANAGPDVQLCPGATDTLGTAADSNYTYSWTPALGLSSATAAQPTIYFATNPGSGNMDVSYILTATWGSCSSRDTVQVTLYPNVNNNFTTSTPGVCINDDLIVNYSGTPSGTATYNWDFDSATVVSGSGAGSYVLTWTAPGPVTISLNVTDQGCSDTPVSKTITVYNTPSPSIIVAGNDSLSTQVYPAYQWMLNGQPIPGANSQSYVATVNGNYTVVATDSGGCADTSKLHTVVGLGIGNIPAGGRVLIYPNPNTGTFVVQTQDAIGGEITISDVLGRVVLKQNITRDNQTIEMNQGEMTSGEYFVSVRVDGSVYTSKVVVTGE